MKRKRYGKISMAAAAIYQMIDVPDGKMTYDKNVWNIISEEADK